MVVRLSALCAYRTLTPHPPPPKTLVLIFVRGCANARVILLLEGLGKFTKCSWNKICWHVPVSVNIGLK
jgi:hypothetical protein